MNSSCDKFRLPVRLYRRIRMRLPDSFTCNSKKILQNSASLTAKGEVLALADSF
jgi:hypothetical protein